MSRQANFRFACRTTTLLFAFWITGSILIAELGGVPYLYGWPLLVVRPEGYDHPRAWVWALDLLGACALLGATWVVAILSYRAQKHGVRFRLATLLWIIAAVAVVATVWRWSEDHLLIEVATFGGRRGQDDELAPATAANIDLTAFMAYLPLWARPLKPAVRTGVLAAIGCTVYVVGRGIATFMRSRLRRSPRREL